MKASNNHKNGWVKAVVGVALSVGLVGFSVGCDYTIAVPGFQQIKGPRNPSVNPAGPGVWDDKPSSAPATHTTTCLPSGQSCGNGDDFLDLLLNGLA